MPMNDERIKLYEVLSEKNEEFKTPLQELCKQVRLLKTEAYTLKATLALERKKIQDLYTGLRHIGVACGVPDSKHATKIIFERVRLLLD